MKFKFLFLTLALIGVIPACSDDEGSKDDGASGSAGSAGSSASSGAGQAGETGEAGSSSSDGESASVEISAEDGGEVMLGEAALSIPGGSLDGDTTVTVETSAPSADLPDAASLKGLIYDFGPDGTEFSEPATLTLPAAGTPGDDEEAVIAWLDESTNTWKNLETTVNADGSLSADIVHFTQFVVRFNGVVTDDCGFEACGGNVVGTWNVTGVCAKGTTELEDICPDAVAEIDLQLSGTATFESDGTRTTNFTSKATITYTLSADCLSEITEGMPPASCDDLSKEADPEEEKGPTTCSGDPEVSCTCVEEGLEKTETKTGGYEIDGKSITMISEDGDEDVLEFCVDGDEARFQQTDGLAVITWIAERR